MREMIHVILWNAPFYLLCQIQLRRPFQRSLSMYRYCMLACKLGCNVSRSCLKSPKIYEALALAHLKYWYNIYIHDNLRLTHHTTPNHSGEDREDIRIVHCSFIRHTQRVKQSSLCQCLGTANHDTWKQVQHDLNSPPILFWLLKWITYLIVDIVVLSKNDPTANKTSDECIGTGFFLHCPLKKHQWFVDRYEKGQVASVLKRGIVNEAYLVLKAITCNEFYAE